MAEQDDFVGAENPLASPVSDPPPEESAQPEPPTPEETQPEPENTVEPVTSTPDDPSSEAEPAPPTSEPETKPPTSQPEEKPVPRKPTTPPKGPSPPPPQQQAKPQAAAPKPPPPDGPQDKKAREFIEQAEKKLKSSQSFFGGLFGGTTKKEEAADLFVRAANAYKVGKRYKAAGEAFRRAAAIHMELDVKHEAATNLVEAGQVMKKDDPREATECYLKAVEIYTDMGRFSLAARYHVTVAEIFETEVLDFEEAITHYEQASD